MATQSDSQPSDRRLNSWKSIGAFFERDERTVKRWERQRGLPVHRIPGAGRSSVYAYTSELAEWLKRTEAISAHSTLEEELPGDNHLIPTDPSFSPPNTPTASLRSAGMISLFTGLVVAMTLAAWLTVSHRSAYPKTTVTIARPAGLKHSANSEAEELYLQGLYYWNKRTPDGLQQALDDFTQSIVHDPNYAPAYAGLANCYNLLREYTLMPSKEAYPRAMAAAQRAITLDDSLADAHNALAFVDFYWSWDAAAAEQEFQRAIALDPNSEVTHHWYATFLMVLGRPQEALLQIEVARQLDPQSSAILADKGMILFAGGQATQAISLLKQIESSDPAFLSPHLYLATLDLELGDYKDYLPESRKAAVLLHDPNRLKIVAAGEKGLAASGGRGMLRAMLRVEQELYDKGNFDAYDLASTYCLLGDKEHALSLLQTAVDQHDERDVALRLDQNLQPLHDDPTFRKLLVRVGLPPLS